MSFESATRKIESHDFAATLGFANNMEMFFKLAAEQSAVAELAAELRRDSGNQIRLLQRASVLLRQQEDLQFRNSRDAAIAVYVWLLNHVERRLGVLAATDALSVPRLWWARKAAIAVLRGSSNKERETKLSVNSQQNTSNANGKDTLLIVEPPVKSIREGRIVDPKAVEVQSEGVSDQHTEHQGFSVENAGTSVLVNR